METKTVMMPRRLTAENGAKAALMGEFGFNKLTRCHCAPGEYDCGTCHGAGEYMDNIIVPWTTIKAIYAAAVKHFGE